MSADRCVRCGAHVSHVAAFGAIRERLCENDARLLKREHGRRVKITKLGALR